MTTTETEQDKRWHAVPWADGHGWNVCVRVPGGWHTVAEVESQAIAEALCFEQNRLLAKANLASEAAPLLTALAEVSPNTPHLDIADWVRRFKEA